MHQDQHKINTGLDQIEHSESGKVKQYKDIYVDVIAKAVISQRHTRR